jgi:beta-galactosidase
MLEDDGLAAVFRGVLADAGLDARTDVNVDFEAVTRSSDDTDFTFAINHGRTPLTIAVPRGAQDLITGATTGTNFTLERYGVAVFATPRAERPPFLTLAP